MLSPIMFSTNTTRKIFSNIIPPNIPIGGAKIPKVKVSHFPPNIPIEGAKTPKGKVSHFSPNIPL